MNNLKIKLILSFNFITLISVYIFCLYIDIFYPFTVYLFCLFVLAFLFSSRLYICSLFNLNILFNIALNRFYLYKYGSPYYMGGSDDLRSFEVPAQQLINGFGKAMNSFEVIISIIINNPTSSNIGYIFIVAFFMKIGDYIDSYYTIVPIFFNSFILSIISLINKEISLKYFKFSLHRSYTIMIITAIFPLIVFMNSHVFRDTLFNLTLILSIYITVIQVRLKLLWIFSILFSICFLRIEYLPLILFNLFILPQYLDFSIKYYKSFKMKLLYIIIFIFSLFTILILYKYNIIEYVILRIQYYDKIRSELSGKFSNYIFKLPMYLRIPSKFIFLLINPTPSYGSVEQSYIGTGTLIQLFFTPVTFIGIYLGLANKNYIAFVFVLLFLMIGFISVDSRHKTFLLIIGIPLTYYGYDYLKSQYKFTLK